jgi:hypothetical protein
MDVAPANSAAAIAILIVDFIIGSPVFSLGSAQRRNIRGETHTVGGRSNFRANNGGGTAELSSIALN